jgi:GT2 family glycosyltransferase
MENNPQVGIASGQHGLIPQRSLLLNLELLTENAEYLEGLSLWNAGVRNAKMLAGTGASIFRIDALKQVNGFDDRFSGVGEDVDVALRIVEAGWQMGWHSSVFYETHGGLGTSKELWNKYFWRGYNSWISYTINKNRYFSLARMSPLGSVVGGILRAIKAYKHTHMKRSFLIPLHFTFKMLAWFTGFIKGQTSIH